MKTVEITSLEFTETQTVINFNSVDDASDQSQPAIGAYTVPGNITTDEALTYVKTQVEADVAVSLNIAE